MNSDMPDVLGLTYREAREKLQRQERKLRVSVTMAPRRYSRETPEIRGELRVVRCRLEHELIELVLGAPAAYIEPGSATTTDADSGIGG